MSKNKEAVSNEEDLTRAKRMILSREQAKTELDAVFDGASKDARRVARQTVDSLFEQAPASQNQRPFMQKEAVAKNVTEYFEKKAYLTTAQRLFPELLKVGSTETQKQSVPSKKPAGAIPTKAIISGDQQ